MSGNSPSELRKREPNSFIKALEKKSSATGSRIILALDPDFRYDTGSLLKEMKGIVEATSDYVCAVKINFHLLLPLSIEEIRELNDFASSRGLASIADIKLNDIGNTNRVATEYLWASGFSAVIVNPFAGYDDGLDAVFTGARKLGKGVVTLAYMSHKGAEEFYGLKLQDGRTMHERFLQKAISWHADAVILGTTRPEVISKSKQILKDGVKIISPGSGIQGGNPVASLLAGADYLIYGRSIVADSDPHSAVKRIYGELLSSSRAS